MWQVLSIGDLSNVEALHACHRMRKDLTNKTSGPEEIKNVVSIVGGRLSYLYKVWDNLRFMITFDCFSGCVCPGCM